MEATVEGLAALVDGRVVGDGHRIIQEITPLEAVKPGSLVWAGSAEALRQAEQSPAGCIVTSEEPRRSTTSYIVAANSKLALAKILDHFHPRRPPQPGIARSCVLGEGVILGEDVAIGPHAVLGDRVRIGHRVVIGAGVVIGDDVEIGDGTVIAPNVTVYDRTQIGTACLIHAGTVIGSDGFGFVRDGEGYTKIPQIGNVIIGDDVEVGANVTIDRATLGSTRIGRGAKIDNLVHVAHNVAIGEWTTLSAQVGIAGSSTVGRHCILAGQVGIADHVIIEDEAIVGAQAGVPTHKRIHRGQVVWGTPARPLDDVKRQIAALGRLPDLLDKLKGAKSIEEAPS